MFDFRRATVFCSGYRLSKHKMLRQWITMVKPKTTDKGMF